MFDRYKPIYLNKPSVHSIVSSMRLYVIENLVGGDSALLQRAACGWVEPGSGGMRSLKKACHQHDHFRQSRGEQSRAEQSRAMIERHITVLLCPTMNRLSDFQMSRICIRILNVVAFLPFPPTQDATLVPKTNESVCMYLNNPCV